MRHLQEQAFDLVLSDLALPGLDGMEVLKRIKALSPDTEVIMITGLCLALMVLSISIMSNSIWSRTSSMSS